MAARRNTATNALPCLDHGPPGPGPACRFTRPHGVFVDADGAVFVGDTENNRVRVIRTTK